MWDMNVPKMQINFENLGADAGLSEIMESLKHPGSVNDNGVLLNF